jgi:hypothetical protein
MQLVLRHANTRPEMRHAHACWRTKHKRCGHAATAGPELVRNAQQPCAFAAARMNEFRMLEVAFMKGNKNARAGQPRSSNGGVCSARTLGVGAGLQWLGSDVWLKSSCKSMYRAQLQ